MNVGAEGAKGTQAGRTEREASGSVGFTPWERVLEWVLVHHPGMRAWAAQRACCPGWGSRRRWSEGWTDMGTACAAAPAGPAVREAVALSSQ